MIYENDTLYIQKEESQIPWLKIFPKEECKELSGCDSDTREKLFRVMLLIETEMIKFYKPKKINIAMFGNYLPKLHIHVMARFEQDSHFPEPMWGKKQRDNNIELPNFELFRRILIQRLESALS